MNQDFDGSFKLLFSTPEKVRDLICYLRLSYSITLSSFSCLLLVGVLNGCAKDIEEAKIGFTDISQIYPVESLKLHEEGVVKIKTSVTKEGLPQNLLIVQSSGFSKLDNAAFEEVKKWHFQPAKKNGVAVNSMVIVPITFKIDNK